MSTSVGRLSQLDQSTLMKLQAGCNYINAELAKQRFRVVIFGVVALILSFVAMQLWVHDFRVLGVGVIATLAFGAYAHRQVSKSYKMIVVRRVVSALGQGMTYTPESSLTKEDFLGMDLFEKRTEKWHSEDEVCGKKNVVSYSLHECKATRTEGSGKNRRTVVIFRGLIVRLDFHKNFQGHTVVVPDREAQILGGLFGESQSRRSKRLVRLENPTFENVYAVYGTDDQEARYLITPKMTELILEAQTHLGAELRLCFIRNSVFVTLPQNTDRFEVSPLFSKVTPESAVGDLVAVVQLAERLVDTLNLETRIWSRA